MSAVDMQLGQHVLKLHTYCLNYGFCTYTIYIFNISFFLLFNAIFL